MTTNFTQALLIFLPAGIANMTPVLSNMVPVLRNWNTPLDFGKHYRGKRIFGANKTWRGLVTGTLIASVAAVKLNLVFGLGLGSTIQTILAGATLGFGALVGDAVESFFKRQKGVPSGERWFPFDQTDYIIGGLLFGMPFMHLRPLDYIVIFIIYFALHLLVSYMGFLLGLKDKPI